ncbi:MAG: hypothetical protein M3P29_10500, partial [Acidobacteriota bacterium]|nr:hypothetical protein [Acidobacteriota bacterium]
LRDDRLPSADAISARGADRGNAPVGRLVIESQKAEGRKQKAESRNDPADDIKKASGFLRRCSQSSIYFCLLFLPSDFVIDGALRGREFTNPFLLSAFCFLISDFPCASIEMTRSS